MFERDKLLEVIERLRLRIDGDLSGSLYEPALLDKAKRELRADHEAAHRIDPSLGEAPLDPHASLCASGNNREVSEFSQIARGFGGAMLGDRYSQRESGE